MSQSEDSQAVDADHVDRVLEQWRRLQPDIDLGVVAVIARLGRLVEHIDASRNAMLGEHGLNRALWDVLASLRRQGPPYRLSPTDLYRELMRTSGAMTNRLATLERVGLVKRVPDQADRRSMLVELTPRGRQLVDEVGPAYLDNERRLLSALDPARQADLASSLRTLLSALEGDERGPRPLSADGARHGPGRRLGRRGDPE
jgi:DNA-binding MarR family transcriptional regulator